MVFYTEILTNKRKEKWGKCEAKNAIEAPTFLSEGHFLVRLWASRSR